MALARVQPAQGASVAGRFLQARDKVSLASRDKQHHLKPTAETARAAEHIRLSFALLEHLSLTLARKGTPFELFGVQVNGGHFRALLSVLSAAVATALVRYIAVSQ